MTTLKDETILITGASRGIGRAIALRAARDGARVAVAAKTAEPHPKLPGTVHSVAAEVEAAGGRALPVVMDARDEDQIQTAVDLTVNHFGGLDVLVNNCSAISLTPTLETPVKRFDLMHQVNVRATFVASRACIPHLKAGNNPHILGMSPPLNLDPRWFGSHLAYTISKYGMSMCVLGLAEELKRHGIAVNALWPRTALAPSAVDLIAGEEARKGCRTPAIMADAAHAILCRAAADYTGHFCLDEDVLREEGTDDFEPYSVIPGAPLLPDFFV